MHLILFAISIGILFYWLRFFWMAYRLNGVMRKFIVRERVVNRPKVSVIVPARNEGTKIEASLRSLQQQTYSNVEVVLVNDRSEDETGTIMKKYASLSAHWTYINVETLPENWLGKNHALHMGATIATGEYIIFTDGDVIFESKAIEESMQSVLSHHLHHVALSPRLKTQGGLLNTMQCIFGMGMTQILQLHKLGKSPNYYVGIGAYNLVKTSLYRSFGGHELIRLEVLDDIMLGKMMVRHGAKAGFMDGKDLISIEWYPTWQEMVRGLEKNSFAALRYSFFRLLLLLASLYGIYLFPYVGIFLDGNLSRSIFGISLLFSHAAVAGVSKRMNQSVFLTFLLPAAILVMGFSFLRSGILATIRGGIRWRDTFYPLKLLKEATKL